MAVHTGHYYSLGEVSIGPPNLQRIRQARHTPDVADAVAHWLAEAPNHPDIYYFAVFLAPLLNPVGQILLHNINQQTGASLVAYHIFQAHQRGRGIGTHALRLLQQFVVEETALTKLIIITARDNAASQALAQTCGFMYVGPPREDPDQGMVFAWHVPERSRRAP